MERELGKQHRVIAQRWFQGKLVWTGVFTGTTSEILTKLETLIRLTGKDKVTWTFVDA